MHNYPKNDVFLDHNMNLCKMIELYLKYDSMHTIVIINAFICINNHVIQVENLCYHYALDKMVHTWFWNCSMADWYSSPTSNPIDNLR